MSSDAGGRTDRPKQLTSSQMVSVLQARYRDVQNWHTGGGVMNPVIVLEYGEPDDGSRPVVRYVMFSDGWGAGDDGFGYHDDRDHMEEAYGSEPIVNWWLGEESVPFEIDRIGPMIDHLISIGKQLAEMSNMTVDGIIEEAWARWKVAPVAPKTSVIQALGAKLMDRQYMDRPVFNAPWTIWGERSRDGEPDVIEIRDADDATVAWTHDKVVAAAIATLPGLVEACEALAWVATTHTGQGATEGAPHALCDQPDGQGPDWDGLVQLAYDALWAMKP